MHDLLALATIRRLLLEMNHVLVPESALADAGALEVWMHQARNDLNGLSPLGVLSLEDGEAQLRVCLARLLSSKSQ